MIIHCALEVGQSDDTPVVLVHGREEGRQVLRIHLPVDDGRRGPELRILLRGFDGAGAEDRGDDIENGEVDNTYVSHEDPRREQRLFEERLQGLPPAQSSRDALEQSEHRSVQRAPVLAKPRVLSELRAFCQLLQGPLRDQRADYVHHHEQQNHRPKQRFQRSHDAEHQGPQRGDEAEDAVDADGAGHFGDAKRAHDPRLPHRGRVVASRFRGGEVRRNIDSHLEEDARDDDEVEMVPTEAILAIH
mmetsp:Transcript_115486/g.331472  ORF Transcript_115486/g.331472 Transcript_115486/m.331472 type:complete len:246 (+) Transcript_115486:492-1229(+)